MDGSGAGVVGSLVQLDFPKEPKETYRGHKLMRENKGSLLSSSFEMVWRNGRYVFWFWLMNITLAEFGAAGFRKSAHAVLDHSFEANRLLRGFDLGTLIALLARPEFGQLNAIAMPAMYFSFVFLVATALFLPGVFAGYASTYRLPREDFFRACGRNLWRFIRLSIIALVVMGTFAGVLFAANAAIVTKAGESTNELLPFEVRMTGTVVIVLIMTTLRIWFDLAEADIVLNDQRAVRKSIWAGLKHTLSSLPRLLTSYLISTVVAAIILVGGLWIWTKAVAPESIVGAFLLAQSTLFLLLFPRFWQRGVAVSYWQQKMLVPVVAAQPLEHAVVPPLPVAAVPDPAPIPSTPASPEGAF
jgi:hypothetical protein